MKVRCSGWILPLQDDTLQVIVEDNLGYPAKILKRMQMTGKERLKVLRHRELDIPHPGVAKNHRETVHLPLRTVGVGGNAFRPVTLRHLAGFGFIPELRENRDRRADLAEVVPEDRGFTVIALALDLVEETNTA
ncbi:MAG: hypothetical protein BWY90_01546 [Deltaproteobacteria bacterium ADurb.BinA014]|nr:MAG: hypothetical protein BWY90_01546 [Deltaproteobacteria bacterium ADurb.BinA014]